MNRDSMLAHSRYLFDLIVNDLSVEEQALMESVNFEWSPTQRPFEDLPTSHEVLKGHVGNLQTAEHRCFNTLWHTTGLLELRIVAYKLLHEYEFSHGDNEVQEKALSFAAESLAYINAVVAIRVQDPLVQLLVSGMNYEEATTVLESLLLKNYKEKPLTI